MSIRLRLTLWYSAVLLVGLCAFAVALLLQTQQAAQTALDDGLRQRARDVAADLRFTPAIVLRADAPDESGRQPGDPALWIRVLDDHGRVVVRQGPPLPGAPPALLATTQEGFQTRSLAGEHHLRLFVRAVTRGGRRAATVQVMTTTDQLELARRQLLVAMGLAGALIVLLAGAAGLLLADRAMRPVARITQLAAQIEAGDLHRRVSHEVWGPGARSRPRNDELGRLARTFDGMLARLEEAGDRRRRLTADAAHELATPIATIASSAEIALRHPHSGEEYREILRHVLEESRHMGRMMDDLLLLARADAGRLPLQQEVVEVDEVCRQAARAFQPLAVARAVSLATQLPARATVVLGDETRLGQVVRNLLDNALRHTPPAGAVTLAVEECADTGGTPSVAIRVCDTGPGVPEADRERIFERFHRGSAAGGASRSDDAQTTGGSGLGLAICRAIVTAHGGHIYVESAGSPACGAAFVVVLPGVTAA